MADILTLVEQLEQLLARGWRVPFTTNAMIDEDAFIDILEQLHIALPTEIREAQALMAQKAEILSEARADADAIRAAAHDEAARLVDQSPIVAQAEARADEIIADADSRASIIQREAHEKANDVVQAAAQEARSLQQGADAYAIEVLEGIGVELSAYLRQVQNGLDRLQVGNAAENEARGDNESPADHAPSVSVTDKVVTADAS
ncbi:MAG: hypothetical protein KDD73_00085 [Anaerolineales bacterium]|nr:hypothetical protein [Anaerolineales bacterium]